MAAWTADQIIALAPDASSAKAGKDLSTPRKWVTSGRSERAIWGECQGSGSLPYQTQIDISEPAFKCSCPSHKFPCKHGLGLFLLSATNGAVADSAEPEWVVKWLDSRSERGEKKVKQQDEKPIDVESQAKRAAQREQKVAGGLGELERWLGDLIRSGLADAQTRPYKFWDGMAARLIDAQAPGLARRVTELDAIPTSGAGWQRRMLESVSLIHLAIEGFRRIETLPPPVQADLRRTIGWSINQADLLGEPGIADKWLVVGTVIEEDERLREQRTWVVGNQSGRTALLLDFAHASQPLPAAFTAGMLIDSEIVYFPGSHPTRALLKSRESAQLASTPSSHASTVADAFDRLGRANAACPWLERVPFALSAVTLAPADSGWQAFDKTGAVRLLAGADTTWRLTAICGGRPIGLFGEWSGDHVRPLTAWADGRVWPL